MSNWVTYNFRGLVIINMAGLGGIQVDMLVVKQLKVEKELSLDPSGNRKSHWIYDEHRRTESSLPK